ncbi:MAG: hypothetical protein IPK83_24400 [Planctomycetes bacterium]|nr:hypothetical protein [Planctomycetota bacterium]
MIREIHRLSWRLLAWFVRRNPLYLISACLTAVGARLFLVHPDDPAGDFGLILVTLGVLQFYEWAVAAILVALYRANRAPEDQPSLLLVAAVFWTGPLVATMEMIALRSGLGTALALIACLIAIAELHAVCRIIRLRLSPATHAIASACLVLVAATAPLLKAPVTHDGMNEVYLYVAWWLFAAITVVSLIPIGRLRRDAALGLVDGGRANNGSECVFLAITIIASLVQLIGLNYAFFCHASAFYASPFLIAVTVLGMAMLQKNAVCFRAILVFLAVIPAFAIGLAFEGFDEALPMSALHRWLRDPVPGIAMIAAAAWWFGAWRFRTFTLLHLGSIAFAFAILRLNDESFLIAFRIRSMPTVLAMYAATVYLATLAWLLASRREALLALAVNLLATILLLAGKTHAGGLIICLVIGWSGLTAVHLMAKRPRLVLRLLPILFLATVPWCLRAGDVYRYQLAIHAASLACFLVVLGRLWPWTRYVHVGLLLVVTHAVAAGAQFASRSEQGTAIIVTLVGFAVLVGGALLSWNKPRLSHLAMPPDDSAAGPSTELTTP